MRKTNLNNNNYEHCCICFPSDIEVISILETLFGQLTETLSLPKIEQTIEQQRQKNDQIDFQRLIKMIFSRKFKTSQPTTSCNHSELKKNFIGKLGFNEKELDRVSGGVAWKMGKFHFHADVVICQSKSFIKQILKSCSETSTKQKFISHSQIPEPESNEMGSKGKEVKMEKEEPELDVEREENKNMNNLFCFWPIKWESFQSLSENSKSTLPFESIFPQ